MSPVDHTPQDEPDPYEPDPCVLLRSRFRSVTAVALAAGISEQELSADLAELAARIVTPVEVRPRLSVVPRAL